MQTKDIAASGMAFAKQTAKQRMLCILPLTTRQGGSLSQGRSQKTRQIHSPKVGEGIWMQKGRSQYERCIEYTEC